MREAVILSAARTPVGRFGGTLRAVTDRDIAALVLKEAIQRAGIRPDQLEEVVFSQQYRTGVLPANMARPIAIDAGIPIEVPEYTVAKACGGSLKTVFLAAQAVKAGDVDLLAAGGVEHMSNAAYLIPTGRWGARLGHAQLMDQLVLFDPISATGGVILTKLIYEMQRRNSRYGLATMCLGGGQGVALIIRNEAQ